MRRMKRISEPVNFLANVTAVLSFVFNTLAFLAAIPIYLFGLSGAKGSWIGDIQPLSFPVRLMILVTFAALLGWGLGYSIARLTKQNTSASVVAATIVTCIWALLLVATADGLATTRSGLPEFALFVLIGMGLIIWLLTFQLRAQINFGNTVIVQDRAIMFAWFASVTVAASLLVQAGEFL